MEDKILINITYSNNDLYVFNTNLLDIFVPSLERIKTAINKPTSIIDINSDMEIIESVVIDKYYIDKDGNIVDYISGNIDDYEEIPLSQEEIEENIKNDIDSYYEDYNKLANGEYEINTLGFDKNDLSIEEVIEVITLYKDKVKVIDLSAFSFDEVLQIINQVDLSDDIRFVTKYNYRDNVSKKEIFELSKYLDSIKKYINRFELSPLEICIFVNDLLREKEYKEVEVTNTNPLFAREEFEEIEFESRSLFKVYNSDKTVCVGFSNLYSSILELFGIHSECITYYSTDNKDGHMSNLVYLNDDKYSTYGVMEVDTTWGRSYNDNEYDYITSVNNYFHFGNSYNKAINIKKHYSLEPELTNTIGRIFSCLDKMKFYGVNNAPYSIYRNSLDEIISSINYIRNKCSNKCFVRTNAILDEINLKRDHLSKSQADLLCDAYKMELSEIDSLILKFDEALYYVRILENSLDSEKFPLDDKLFRDSCNSRKTPEEALISAIFGKYLSFSSIVSNEKIENGDNPILKLKRN